MSMIWGVKPIKYDKKGPAYSQDEVNLAIVKKINNEEYFSMKAKAMGKDIECAIEKTELTIKEFNTVIDRFFHIESSFIDKSKKASSGLRDAAEKMAQGISRVEKAANFERLERYVILLERAAEAMNTLAKLESEGKLEKIAGALK